MASMGELLMIGVGFTLVSTLIVLPALLGVSQHTRERR
jgi:predicted RND superfamily exporter protein